MDGMYYQDQTNKLDHSHCK